MGALVYFLLPLRFFLGIERLWFQCPFPRMLLVAFLALVVGELGQILRMLAYVFVYRKSLCGLLVDRVSSMAV